MNSDPNHPAKISNSNLADEKISGAPSIAASSPWVGLSWLLIPLLALVAVLPLIFHGASCGHDFDFHLLSWMEAARQFSLGNLHPHWAYTPAYNAGEPRFVFYPPLSWTLGALLGLILTHLPHVSEAAAWSATPILFTWIALTLSGLTFYRLARSFAGANAALLAAALYLANPYMLFTAYERTAYAELLAAAWIPLLLHAILRRRVTIPRIALPVALLWLTNAPAAVMGTYTLAFLAALRLATEAFRANRDAHTVQRTHENCLSDTARSAGEESPHSVHRAKLSIIFLALKVAAGTALGFALAAFYLVPAAYERRFVQIAMATISGMRIDANFLFEHTGTTADDLLHDTVLHTASSIAVALLITTALALIAVYLLCTKQGTSAESGELSDRSNFPILPLGLLTAGIAFLLVPISLPIWNHLPQATFLQFPWRLLAILAPVCALTLARVFTNLSEKVAASSFTTRWLKRIRPTATAFVAATLAIVLTAALARPAVHRFRQVCDDEDTAPARLALFHSDLGADPTDEYTPVTADNDALNPEGAVHTPAPAYWIADTPNAPSPTSSAKARTDADDDADVSDHAPQNEVATQSAPTNLAPTHLTLATPRAEFLILNLRNYPAWSITRNGVAIPQDEQRENLRDDGLIAIALPAGLSTVDIRFACTADQSLGDILTLIALVLLLLAQRSEEML
ncbi:MAG: hypothetical protein P4K80_09470 [Acidobacteriaceae bacterium]|nr:hypothetical protein [Acidobacteriaceae bacterium]